MKPLQNSLTYKTGMVKISSPFVAPYIQSSMHSNMQAKAMEPKSTTLVTINLHKRN